MKKLLIYIFVFVILCACSTNKKTDNYVVALLYSGERSQINLLDKDNNVDISLINQTNAVGEEVPIVYNKANKLIFSYYTGYDKVCDNSIIGTNIDTLYSTKYLKDNNKDICNVTGMTTHNNHLYVTSNVTGGNLILTHNFKKYKTQKEWNEAFSNSILYIKDNKLFSIADFYNEDYESKISIIDLNNMKEDFIEIDNEYQVISDLTIGNDNIYIGVAKDNESYYKKPVDFIYKYNINTKKKEKIKLPYKYVNKLLFHNSKVYITHADFFDQRNIQKISIYDEKTKEINTISTPGLPKQITISKDKLYVYNEYGLKKEGWVKEIKNGEISCNKADIFVYDVSGKIKEIEAIDIYSSKYKVKDKCFASFVGID